MRLLRYVSLLVSASLLGLPAVAAAPATAATDYDVPTRVEMTMSPHAKRLPYKTTFSLSGRVVGTDPTDGEVTTVHSDGRVLLERRLAGSTQWRVLDSTTSGSFFFYPVTAVQNASYRVRYTGGSYSNGVDTFSFGPSNSARGLKVSRTLSDSAVNRDGRLYLKGVVRPSWNRKPVTVQRKTCKGCAWKAYDTVRTGRKGAFSVRVKAPGRRNVSWYYRARVRADRKFVESYSDTYRAYTY